MRSWSVASSLFLAACAATPKPDAGTPAPCELNPSAPTQFGGARPVRLHVPDGGASCPLPLVVVLHGYGASGELQAAYLGLDTLVEGRHVLLAAPTGTVDDAGSTFWSTGNASCCNFFGNPVDDVGYVRGLISDIRASWPVDPERIILVGHSNGGFFAHRLACELNEVTHVAALAGTEDVTALPCARTRPVRVLQFHGTADDVVKFDGGSALRAGAGSYVGAQEMVTRWAARNGCGATTRDGGAFDLESGLSGAETTVQAFDGCPDGGDVTLWSIEGGSHLPSVGTKLPPAFVRWSGL